MNFFKTTLASTVGTLLGGAVVLIFFFLILGAVIGSAIGGGKDKDKVEIKKNSVLKMSLSGEIAEKGTNSPFDIDQEIPLFGSMSKLGLYDLTEAIKAAKEDDRIEGIYLKVAPVQAGWATLETLREALVDFQSDGKFVYAYSEVYSEKSYYLASAATESYIYPKGFMEFNGYATNPIFFKGMFDKLGIEPKVFKVGTFKSAVEPFINEEMSDANRLQTETFMNELWSQFVTNVGASRDISVEKLNEIAQGSMIENAEDAVELGLIDKMQYEDEVLDKLMEETDAESYEDIHYVSAKKYIKATNVDKKDKEQKVAVIFAQGNIVDGKGQDDQIGSATIAAALRKAREDENVKGVVLRVNSGGGSALASDVIWREVVKTKESKPIVASMGDVAASGGYYISAATDKIFAQPNTITGSIGVFGMMVNTEQFFEEKVGLDFDRAVTHQYADMGNPNREMTDEESAKIQNGVNEVYSSFIKVVQEGRGFSDSASVDAIAQGRVWSGVHAADIGLVDELGGLDDAIAWVADKAGLEEDKYSIKAFPEETDPFEELMKGLTEAKVEVKLEDTQVGEDFSHEIQLYKQMKAVLSHDGVYMLMPYSYDIE